jgi:toxin YhaV
MASGWTLYAPPLWLAQVEVLASQVEALKARDPRGFTRKTATKRLAAITKLAVDMIPQDPGRPESSGRK